MCVLPSDPTKSVRFAESQKSCEKSSCVGAWKNDGVEINANDQGNRRYRDADVIVRDPMADPNDQNEQSSDVLPDDHIKATRRSTIIGNSCKDKCAQF